MARVCRETGSSVILGWTQADQAELDTITWTLLRALVRHTPRCRLCLQHVNCPSAAAALEACTDWVTHRRLLSQATYLRVQ